MYARENKPNLRLIERVRNAMRLRHYSLRTEWTYWDWIERSVSMGCVIPKRWLNPRWSRSCVACHFSCTRLSDVQPHWQTSCERFLPATAGLGMTEISITLRGDSIVDESIGAGFPCDANSVPYSVFIISTTSADVRTGTISNSIRSFQLPVQSSNNDACSVCISW